MRYRLRLHPASLQPLPPLELQVSPNTSLVVFLAMSDRNIGIPNRLQFLPIDALDLNLARSYLLAIESNCWSRLYPHSSVSPALLKLTMSERVFGSIRSE